MSEPTVVVGFCDSGEWSACFGLSYRDLLLTDALGPGRIVRPGGAELRVQAGTMGVAGARNEIVERFLDRTDGDLLFMIDTDMGFGPDILDRLLSVVDPETTPVVGGLCFALKRDPRGSSGVGNGVRYRMIPTLYEYVELPDEVGFRSILDYERDTLVRVAGTGAACLLIHRNVLTEIRSAHGDTWFDPIQHPTGSKGKPRTFSEDLSFCLRVAAVDQPVHVYTAAQTTHHKGGLYLDQESYDEQRSRAREVVSSGA